MIFNNRANVLGIAFAVLSFTSISFAQDTTAKIVGTITDGSGGGVSNAKVTIFSVDRQLAEQTVKTGSAGEYVAALLPVGTYNVIVEAPGFKKSVREGIALNVNDTLTVNSKLEVGDVTQSVTVQEAPVQVQLQNGAEQSTTVTGTQVRELALVTRNYQQLIGLMPGVTSGSVDQLYVGNSLRGLIPAYFSSPTLRAGEERVPLLFACLTGENANMDRTNWGGRGLYHLLPNVAQSVAFLAVARCTMKYPRRTQRKMARVAQNRRRTGLDRASRAMA